MGACVVNQPFIGEGAHSRIDLDLIYWGVGTHRPQFLLCISAIYFHIDLNLIYCRVGTRRPQFIGLHKSPQQSLIKYMK